MKKYEISEEEFNTIQLMNLKMDKILAILETEPEPEPIPIPDDSKPISDYGVHPIDSQIAGLDYRGSYYGGALEGNGYWIAYQDKPVIIKRINGVQTTEVANSYIGTDEFNKLDLSEVNLTVDPKKKYILFQGAGKNALWYQKTKSLTGDQTTFIGIKSDKTASYNKIYPNFSGLILKNIVADSEPNVNYNKIIKGSTINLQPFVKGINPVLSQGIEGIVDCDGVTIDVSAIMDAGFHIEKAKSVNIRNSSIAGTYANNGIRIGRVEGECVLTNNVSGKGFNTAFQASANREALSIGYRFESNKVIDVLEEGLGFDSYANLIDKIPVITKFYISKAYKSADGTVIDIDKMYFIEQGTQNRNKQVNASFVGKATNYLFVIDSLYLDFRVLSYEPYNDGNSLRLVLDTDFIPNAGLQAGLVTGFYKCSITNSIVNGVVPKTGQPGHALSLWGGGFHNTISGSKVKGGRSGLNMASLEGFGVENPVYYLHCIGNKIDNNSIVGTESAIRITSEYAKMFGSKNELTNGYTESGTVYINNQLDFKMFNNDFVGNSVLLENVSGVFEAGSLTDTVVILKNCPNLKVGSIDLIGSSEIITK